MSKEREREKVSENEKSNQSSTEARVQSFKEILTFRLSANTNNLMNQNARQRDKDTKRGRECVRGVRVRVCVCLCACVGALLYRCACVRKSVTARVCNFCVLCK